MKFCAGLIAPSVLVADGRRVVCLLAIPRSDRHVLLTSTAVVVVYVLCCFGRDCVWYIDVRGTVRRTYYLWYEPAALGRVDC